MAAVPPARSESRSIELSRTERKPPATAFAPHAHHRNTSIVNGIQHSRSGSFITGAPSTGPASNQQPPPPVPPLVGMPVQIPPAVEGQIEIPQIPDSPTTPVAGGAMMGGTHGSGFSTLGGSTLKTQKSTRSRGHHHHHSGGLEGEMSSPIEYALHILFTQFVTLADRIIDTCVPPRHPMESEPYVDKICGPDVDKAFDKLISSLGALGKHKPKMVIDSVMYWRKLKSEAAAKERQAYEDYVKHNQPGNMNPPMPGLQRRNTEPVHAAEPWNPQMAAHLKEKWAIADRRTVISIYLLCRTLIEVVGQTTLDCLTPEMADKLQDIVFRQISTSDPRELLTSPLRLANWTVLAQLLGVIGNIDFDRVTDRQFFVWLEKTHSEDKDKIPRDLELRTEYVVKAIGFLKLKLYPEEALKESAEFMVSLARFFSRAHGFGVKHAYCDVFTKLLLPVAGSATSELNHPVWAEFINTLSDPLNEMMTKQKHWNISFPVMSILLCVAPAPLFTAQWTPFLEANLFRLRDKDRTSKVHVLQAMARFLWVFLFRCPAETLNATTKKLEQIVRVLLAANPKKKEQSVLIGDQTVVNPGIEIIRLIGFKHQDLCFRTVIFPLLNSDSLVANTNVHIDQLSPERMLIGIRAFMAIMADLESGKQPPFPAAFGSGPARIPVPEISEDIKTQLGRSGRISQAVNVTKLSETAKEYHDRFCEILGRIVTICDTFFGGQAMIEEKLVGAPAQPRTPVSNSFSFGIRDDHPAPDLNQKKHFFELLHVAIQALPRCLPPNIPFPKIVNLLCNGTAHSSQEIASASSSALKSLARQYNSQQVIMGFSRFIFTFDERYNSSDGGMLGFGHIERTLELYVELLQIWLENIKRKNKASKEAENAKALAESLGSPPPVGVEIIKDLESSNIKTYVEEIESNGLFFLCSQSRVVRRYAITVLRIIREFDAALGDRDLTRIIDILEKDSLNVINLNDDNLPVAERSRLQRELRESKSHDALIQYATSEIQYEAALWFRVFPKLIRVCFDQCPTAVALCRDNVCSRLSQMHSTLITISELGRPGMQFAETAAVSRMTPKEFAAYRDIVIDQWKLYLIVACSTLTSTADSQKPMSRVPSHARKSSKNQGMAMGYDRITNAHALFQMVMPLLSRDNAKIREAAVVGLGSINVNLYKTLIETLQSVVMLWAEDTRSRIHKTGASPRKNRQDRLRAEVTHIFQLTSHFLQRKEIYEDEWILKHLVAFVRDTKSFLEDPEVKMDWEQQPLRTYFCGLVEELYIGLSKTDPGKWLPFEGRLSCFELIQEWCGYGPKWPAAKAREERSMQIWRQGAGGERDLGRLARSMEIEKRGLRVAALGAMAALCAGPVMESIDSKAVIRFDDQALFSWIESIFSSPAGDRFQRLGQRALKNILLHNQHTPYLLHTAIHKCYLYDGAHGAKGSYSYFSAVAEVLEVQGEEYAFGYWKTCALCLFKIGEDDLVVRNKAANLLRVTEERLFGVSKVQDFEVSISDKTAAVYKRAAFELSKALSKMHTGQAPYIISELTRFFNLCEPKSQRTILAVLLPWIQTIELQLEPNNEPTPVSYMVLANLFEITVRFSSKMHNEVEALWTALATAQAGNVQVILSFIINQSLERKEPNFVEYGKQVVVFLAGTPYGAKLLEALINYLQPRLTTMVGRERSTPPSPSLFPYLADLTTSLPEGVHQTSYSYGHLALILLVDLLVGPNPQYQTLLPLLLQNVFIHWDSHIPLVQEQAKEMLIHLIHELVIPTLTNSGDKGEANAARQATREFIEAVRRRDAITCWEGEEVVSEKGLRVPGAMEHMIADVLEIFGGVVPGLKEEWGRISLQWATTLPVLKLACRSFQVFRCMLTTLDQGMLADMLARLSNAIADDKPDRRLFAMEILITLNTIAGELDGEDLRQYPQIFWTAVACLNTVHEKEFMEVLSLLDKLLDKLDLRDPSMVQYLLSYFPQDKWEGKFEGVQELIVKGLRSSVTLSRTLDVFDKLNSIPSNPLVGGDNRLLFAVLANMPRFIEALEQETPAEEILTTAARLKDVAETQSAPQIARVMSLFSQSRLKMKAFITQTVSAIKDTYFPTYEAETLIFLIGLLSNKLPWVKLKTMKLLSELLPFIDMRKPSFHGIGADVISPLLRLLQTEYCSQALEVLNKTITINSGPLDRHIIRMSMGNRSIRKEYESTQTIFGIPDESGWAIPMPAINASATRSNVHAVFYTCKPSAQDEAALEAMAGSTLVGNREEVQFHVEDYIYTSLDRSANGEEVVEGVDDMVLRLETLDAFFTDADDTNDTLDSDALSTLTGTTYQGRDHTPSNSQSYLSSGSYGHSHTPSTTSLSLGLGLGEGSDAAPHQIYDTRVAAILNRSLARNSSVSSFHNTFAESLSQDYRPGSSSNHGHSYSNSSSSAFGYQYRVGSSPVISEDGYAFPRVDDGEEEGAWEGDDGTPRPGMFGRGNGGRGRRE